MTRIDHVALWVLDLEGMCSFYAKTFGAKIGPRYENASKGFASRFVTLDSGARIEFMTTKTLEPVQHEPGAQRMGLTHLAIALGSESAVDELTARLRAEGMSVLDGPRRTGDGYYESVILDPEGNRLELTA
jgi:lactoylglutathione lyase